MMKKITITLAITCLLFISIFNSVQFSQAQNSPTISLTPSTVTLTNPSETFELAFKVNDVNKLWAWRVDVTWDSQYFEMTKNPMQGDFSQDVESVFTYSINKVPSTKGAIDVMGIATANEAMLTNDVPSGSGTLAIFTFKILKPVVNTEITGVATQLLSPPPENSQSKGPPIVPYPATTSATTTVSYIPSDGSPVAHAGSNQTINQFTTVTLDASQSLPQDLPDQTYTWTFTDNASRTLTGKTVNYTFDWPGVIPVTLTVTNTKGTSTAIIYIIVICITPPVPIITLEGYSGQTINVAANQNLIFYSNQSYDPYNLTIRSIFWDFGDGQTSNVENDGHRYTNLGTYTVSLTVGNSAGLNATATKTIVVGDGAPVSSISDGSGSSNKSDPNALISKQQQSTLSLPQIILYPLIFVTVFAIGGATFWLRKKTDTSSLP